MGDRATWPRWRPGCVPCAGVDPQPTWQALMAVLEAHNAKEELIVYPNGDQILTERMADDVRHALLSEETPEGWVCQLAGRS